MCVLLKVPSPKLLVADASHMRPWPNVSQATPVPETEMPDFGAFGQACWDAAMFHATQHASGASGQARCARKMLLALGFRSQTDDDQ